MDVVLPFTYTSSVSLLNKNSNWFLTTQFTVHHSCVDRSTHADGKFLSLSLPEQSGGYRLLGTDQAGLGREKGGDTEIWAGVTKKAEVVAWQKLAYSGFMHFTLFSVTLPEIGKQSLCSARTVSKILSS